jgi:hypothetical protein
VEGQDPGRSGRGRARSGMPVRERPDLGQSVGIRFFGQRMSRRDMVGGLVVGGIRRRTGGGFKTNWAL